MASTSNSSTQASPTPMLIVDLASNEQSIHNDHSDVIVKIGESLYLNDDMADFYFMFETSEGQYESVPAHKMLLITASDVFRTMFNGTWEEEAQVQIVDASIVEFKEFLQFIYLKDVKISMDHVAKVMYLADKYNIPTCLNVCEKFIINILEEDNVFWAYDLAITYNQANLRKYCETFIGINAKTILKSGNFLECDSNMVGNILKLDLLSCPENEVFEACIYWAKTTAKVDRLTREILQAQLGRIFYEIRFKSMTPLQFAMLVPSYGYLLSADEYGDISQAVAVKDFQPNIFSKDLRTSYKDVHFNKESLMSCDRLLSVFRSMKPYPIKNAEKTIFSTNTPVLLRKLYCCKVFEYRNGAYCDSRGLSTEIKIVQVPHSAHSEEEIVLHNANILLQNTQSTGVTVPPLLIRPGVLYEIRFKMSSSEPHCSDVLLKSMVEMRPNIIIQFHNDPTVGGDPIARGLIFKLKFVEIFGKIF